MVVEAKSRPQYSQLSGLTQEGLARHEIAAGSDQAKLLKACLAPFNNSSLRILPNEGEPFLPKKDPEFQTQASQIFSSYTKDVFDHEGNIKQGKERQFSNLQEIAPAVLRIVIDSDNKVDGVHQAHALNTLAKSLQIAQNPETRVGLEVGIGGSTAPFTSPRFLTYGLGALKTVEQLHEFYEARSSRSITTEVVKKTSEGREGMSAERKKEIRREVQAILTEKGEQGLVDSGYLNDADLEQIKRKYGILDQLPILKFVFTPEAAKVINFEDRSEEVTENFKRNKAALKSFIDQGSPIADHVFYVSDTPWSSHSEQTTKALDQLSAVLAKNEDPSVAKEVERLKGMGFKHGGEQGSQRSLRYAAMHSLAFEDPGLEDVPYLEYPDPETEAKARNLDVVITRGCRRERSFNILRIAMVEAVKASSDEIQESDKRIGINMIDTISAQVPAYYNDQVDWDLRDPSVNFEDKLADIDNESKSLKKGTRKSQLGSIVDDLKFLQEEMARRKVTLAMIA